MSPATKQDLLDLKSELKTDFREAITSAVELLITEMGIRFAEVNGRLDRVDATLQMHGKQIAAGTKAIAALTEWSSKADADYKQVLTRLADLTVRVVKIESRT